MNIDKIDTLPDKNPDGYEIINKRAKLERFKLGIKESEFDENLDNYRLMGSLKFMLNNELNKGKIIDNIYYYIKNKFGEFYLTKDEMLEENIKYGNITNDEILKAIKRFSDGNGLFKCLCTKKGIRIAYIMKHRELKYYIITGINCYKGIRGDKCDERYCIKCDILLTDKKDIKLFYCKKCIYEIEQKKIERFNKINEKNRKINNYIINKEKEKLKIYFNILKENFQNKLKIKKEKKIVKINKYNLINELKLKIKKQKEFNKIEKLKNSYINFGKYENHQIDYVYKNDFKYIEKCVLNFQNKFYEKYNKNPKYDNIVTYYIYQQKTLLNINSS